MSRGRSSLWWVRDRYDHPVVTRRAASACCQPRMFPLRWLAYGERHSQVVDGEIDAAFSEAPTQKLLTAWYGDFEDVLARAARGELVDGDGDDRPEIKPVRLDPLIWELRWSFRGRPLRLYFAQIGQPVSGLLALRVHWKSLDGTQDHIDAAQEQEMTIASNRLRKADLAYTTPIDIDSDL